ncbi:MAG: VWA domain-containing protein, partial [Salinirussus sp.]
VRAYIPQDSLHPSADDHQNQVIDMVPPIASFMTNTTLAGNAPDGPAKLNASKSAANTYSAFAEPLKESGLDIGEEVELSGGEVPGPPVDATLILDRSFSMHGGKLADAKDGAKAFVGKLNASRDRASVVYYNDEAEYSYIESGGKEYFFSNNFAAVNSSIDDPSASGSTAIYKGINYSTAVFDFKGNQTHRKVAVLLTDGQNTVAPDGGGFADDATVAGAELANKRDITIYTIGYGSGADEDLMKDIANATGGRYCFADNESAVINCFEEFGDLINPQSAIATTPITANVTSGGSVFDADIPGNTSDIASATHGSHSFLNLNDPTAPSLFKYSFTHRDNETMSINMTSYQCEPDAWNLTGETKSVGGETLAVVRCTDLNGIEDSYGADIYVDGERPDTLLQTTYADWQTDVNESLDEFPDVNISASTGEFEAESNQALAVFDLPPVGAGTRNTLALLVQFGLSDEAGATEIVSVRVAEAEIAS